MITRPPSPLRRLLPLLALFLLPAGAAAQTEAAPVPVPASVVFAGRVLDRATGQPIAGAQVEFPQHSRRAVADSTGAFSVGELTAGQHDLVVFAPGYQPVAVVVALREGMPSVDVPLAVAAADSAGTTEFAGMVVDASSGKPIQQARVEFVGPGRPVATDAEGVFHLRGVQTGPQMLRVRATGYPTLASMVVVEPGTAPALIKLEQDVVLLQGLTVVVDRMERRRQATGLSSQVMVGASLATSSAPDMYRFVQQHFGVQESVCGGIGEGAASGCVIARGGTPVVPSIVVDDVPQFGGTDILYEMEPDDFERVEVYGGGRTILLYTTAYMERQARMKNPPLPYPIGT